MPSASVAEDEALAAALDESLAAAFPSDDEQPPPPSAGVIVETAGWLECQLRGLTKLTQHRRCSAHDQPSIHSAGAAAEVSDASGSCG